MSAFRSLFVLTWLSISTGLSFGQSDQQYSNWPQWRGPNADGVAGLGADPPSSWSEAENIAWKVAIQGEGSSTPIIWEDQVFLISAVETQQKPEHDIEAHPETLTRPTGKIFDFKAICLDRNTGEIVWDRTLASVAPHEGRHDSTTYASASPTTDGMHLYVSFGSYGVFCLTLDGDIVWSQDLGDMRTRRGWGEAVSPVISGEKLIVMWDQEDQSRIYALNRVDGETAWSVERDEPTTWATPLIVNQENRTQVITAGTNHIRSYGLGRGELLWESLPLTLNAIPCPVQDGDNVILMSGYRGNVAVALNVNGDNLDDPELIWQREHDTPYVPSPLLTNGRLYFTKGNEAILTCLDSKTGNEIYGPKRLPALRSFYASPVASERFIYFTSRQGKTMVLNNSEQFQIAATNVLDAEVDASPAIVGNQIFIRSKTHLYCIENLEDE